MHSTIWQCHHDAEQEQQLERVTFRDLSVITSKECVVYGIILVP